MPLLGSNGIKFVGSDAALSLRCLDMIGIRVGVVVGDQSVVLDFSIRKRLSERRQLRSESAGSTADI